MSNTVTFKTICLFIALVVFSFATFSTRAQGSKQIAQLSTLCRVWGLLKYYHPEVSTGKHDWDAVLISSLDRILASRDGLQLDLEVQKMLDIAGKDTAAANLPRTTEAINVRNLDNSWIKNDKMLNKLQKEALAFIATHPFVGQNFYAQPNPQNDSTVHTPNEKPYIEMQLPNTSYRLLGLFRFWNVINYFYPYKYAIGKPWKKVLDELVPQMTGAKDTLSYHKALARMAASINDSHGGLWPQVYDTITGAYSPSFDFRIIGNYAVVTRTDSSNLQSQIRAGSVIETIDGIPLKRKIASYWDFVPASNTGGKLKSMHYIILNSKNKTATYSGRQPDGTKFNAVVELKERDLLKDYKNYFEMESLITYKMLADSIGYVFFSNINSKNVDSIMKQLKHTKAIIFDMRNYPSNGGGTYITPQYLLKAPQIYSRLTRPDFQLPGMLKFEVANIGTTYAQVGKINPEPYQGQIILLADSRTQSAAEWACMTLKTAPNVTVIGSQTAGADGNVTRTILPGGYRINFSGLGIYYPDGTDTQRIGIRVDIPVSYTISDIINRNDPLLKRALAFIRLKQ